MAISVMTIVAAILAILAFKTPVAGVIGSIIIVIAAISLFVKEVKINAQIHHLQHAVILLCKDHPAFKVEEVEEEKRN